MCVQVCPVGIDIRNGLQYECIGCGLCIDACNSIMDKMEYQRGLIRLTTQNAMAGLWRRAQVLRRIFRPRVLIYSAVLIGLSVAMIVSLALRQSVKVDVIRDRASLSRIVAGGKLENVYRLQIMNATEQAQRYRISAHGLDGLELASEQEVEVGPAETRGIAARLQIPYGSAEPGSHTVFFDIDAVHSGAGRASEKAVFLVPR